MHSFISVIFGGSLALRVALPWGVSHQQLQGQVWTGSANLWLGRQGQLFTYKRSVKRWLGREGNPLTRDNSPAYKEALRSPWRPTETSTYYSIAIAIAVLNLLPLLLFLTNPIRGCFLMLLVSARYAEEVNDSDFEKQNTWLNG